MSREVSPRFASSLNPRAYQFLYETFYRYFEMRGGINVTDAKNIPRRGKKVVTGNHDKKKDPWVGGVIVPESLFSLGKKDLGTYKYGYVGRWALAPLMNTVLIERSGRDYNILENMADFMIDKDAAVQTFLYGTRQPEKKKGAMPKTGVAHLAIRSSTPEEPTPIIPIGYATKVWTPGRPIQAVVGEPIYAPPDGRELSGFALKRERRRITDEVVVSVTELAARAIELDAEGAGIPGRVIWNE